MCVPLVEERAAEVHVRGVVNIARTRPHAVFTPRDLDVATSIASMLADGLSSIEARRAAAESAHRLAAAERFTTVGELAAGIAHEVANPLACMRANIEALKSYLAELLPALRGAAEQDPTLREALADVPLAVSETLEGIGRAEEVVRHVKSLIRMDSGVARNEAVTVAQVVRSTLRFLRLKLPQIRVRIDDDATVKGSAAELSQVLVNLLVNAADACTERAAGQPTGAYTPVIEIDVEQRDDHVHIVVSDNGIGMSEEISARVFMPLFTTKSAANGTGLGLPIVRRLVERHGGVIRVSSQVGAGTRFSITLPRERPLPPPQADDTATVHPLAAP